MWKHVVAACKAYAQENAQVNAREGNTFCFVGDRFYPPSIPQRIPLVCRMIPHSYAKKGIGDRPPTHLHINKKFLAYLFSEGVPPISPIPHLYITICNY